MRTIALTDEESAAIRLHFPRVPLAAVRPATAEARAIKKIAPGCLPHATERDTPLEEHSLPPLYDEQRCLEQCGPDFCTGWCNE